VAAVGRDDVGPSPPGAQLGGQLLQPLGHLGAHLRVDEADVRPQETHEEEVPLLGSAVRVFPQRQIAGEPEPRARRRGLAAVIRLRRRAGHDRVGPLRPGVSEGELELTRLVAPQPQPGAVVALDQDPRSAERRREAFQLLERRGQVGEPDARERVDPGLERREVHRFP
jgi:hypothetical protein